MLVKRLSRGVPFVTERCMKGYKPVNIVALAGPQGTIPVKCEVNEVLLATSLSILGVRAFLCFMKPKQSHLH